MEIEPNTHSKTQLEIEPNRNHQQQQQQQAEIEPQRSGQNQPKVTPQKRSQDEMEFEPKRPAQKQQEADIKNTPQNQVEIQMKTSLPKQVEDEPKNVPHNKDDQEKSTEKWSHPRKSPIWEYAREETKDDKKSIICKLCSKTFDRSKAKNTTTGILNHLKYVHFKCFPDLDEDPSNPQQKLTKFVKPKRRLLDAVVKMVVDSNLPLSFVERGTFTEVIKAAREEVNSEVPTSDILRKEIQAAANQERQKLTTLLQEIESLAVSLDVWTSQAGESYMGIKTHWIDQQWKLQEATLGLSTFRFPHTKERARLLFEKCMEEYKILSKCTFLVTDQGSNLQDILPGKQLHCAAHKLQLTVRKGLEKVSPLMSKVRECISFFSSSNKNMQLFHDIQEEEYPDRKIINPALDNITRWNSTFRMVDAFINNKGEIRKAIQESDEVFKRKETLLKFLDDVENSKQLLDLSEILKRFKDATELLESKAVVTSSFVPQIVQLLKNDLDVLESSSCLKDVVHAFQEQMKQRWNLEESPLLVASFLDPRFKKLTIFQDDASKLFHQIQQKLEHQHIELTEKVMTKRPIIQNPESEKLIQNPFFMKLDKPKPPVETPFQTDFKKYELVQEAPLQTDPMSFWSLHSKDYEMLSKDVKKYWCIPSTTASVERLFSKAGNIVTEKRTSLTQEIVGDIVLLKDAIDQSRIA